MRLAPVNRMRIRGGVKLVEMGAVKTYQTSQQSDP
jgi:hypothetical protein